MGNKQNKKIKNKNKNNNNNINIIQKENEPMKNKEDIYKFKILFHAEAGVGTKTSLIKK